MFAHNKDSCPLCGVIGHEFQIPETAPRKGKGKGKTNQARNCPSCGTVFNEFGIILSPDEEAGRGLEPN